MFIYWENTIPFCLILISWKKGGKPAISSYLSLSLLFLILSQYFHLQNELDTYNAPKLLPELVPKNEKVLLLTGKGYDDVQWVL